MAVGPAFFAPFYPALFEPSNKVRAREMSNDGIGRLYAARIRGPLVPPTRLEASKLQLRTTRSTLRRPSVRIPFVPVLTLKLMENFKFSFAGSRNPQKTVAECARVTNIFSEARARARENIEERDGDSRCINLSSLPARIRRVVRRLRLARESDRAVNAR